MAYKISAQSQALTKDQLKMVFFQKLRLEGELEKINALLAASAQEEIQLATSELLSEGKIELVEETPK